MSDTQLIKDKIDIVDLIQEYVQLKPAGINHKGCCPFHQEKTPSFMVNRERQSFHCFGCSKGGDIFTFLQEIEGMEFVEALKFLANKAGVELSHSFQNEAQSSQKNRLKEVNSAATSFFYNFLNKMEASKPARDYLQERGLTQDTIDEWQVGFVPEQWDLLTQYLLKKGFSIDDLVASGLTIKRDGASVQSRKGFYDRFRGRIMFPIHDIHGNVVGFTGRVLVETDRSGGKYVNTPQTVIYDKSRVVFGLYKAKKEIRSSDLIVVVEGQTDVISSHQAGMKNVVASSGTAFTEHQVKLLKRYSNNMNMAFDSDEAGVKAARRGINLAVAEGMNVKVIKIPEGAGKDPDECIKKDQDVWFHSVDNAQAVMDWYFSMAFQNKEISDPKQKQGIVNELLPEIKIIPYAVERDHWLQELSSRLGVDVEVLREDLARVSKESKNNDQRSTINEQVEKKVVVKEKSRLDILSERLFELLLRFPKLFVDRCSSIVDVNLSTPSHLSLYKELQNQYNTNKEINIEKLRETLKVDNGENVVDILLMKGELDFSGIQEKEAEREIEKLSTQIQEGWKKKKRQELQLLIAQAEKVKDEEKLTKLLQEFQAL